jgi:hypothetical protein
LTGVGRREILRGRAAVVADDDESEGAWVTGLEELDWRAAMERRAASLVRVLLPLTGGGLTAAAAAPAPMSERAAALRGERPAEWGPESELERREELMSGTRLARRGNSFLAPLAGAAVPVELTDEIRRLPPAMPVGRDPFRPSRPAFDCRWYMFKERRRNAAVGFGFRIGPTAESRRPSFPVALVDAP